MAATKDILSSYREGILVAFPVKADTRIFHGTFVCLSGGYAVPGSGDEGQVFVGIAQGQADNRGGADGAKTVLVRRTGVFEMAATSISAADVGSTMYLVDDMTFDNADPGHGLKVGTLVRFISSTRGEIDISKAVA